MSARYTLRAPNGMLLRARASGWDQTAYRKQAAQFSRAAAILIAGMLGDGYKPYSLNLRPGVVDKYSGAAARALELSAGRV
jgi:hypothetical protein